MRTWSDRESTQRAFRRCSSDLPTPPVKRGLAEGRLPPPLKDIVFFTPRRVPKPDTFLRCDFCLTFPPKKRLTNPPYVFFGAYSVSRGVRKKWSLRTSLFLVVCMAVCSELVCGVSPTPLSRMVRVVLSVVVFSKSSYAPLHPLG